MLGPYGTAAIGLLFIPGFVILVKTFDEMIRHISLLNGCLIITLGVSAYACGAQADASGKRLILFTSLFALVTSGWGPSAKSYSSFWE